MRRTGIIAVLSLMLFAVPQAVLIGAAASNSETTDIYSMTQAQLQLLPPAQLQAAIDTLTTQNNAQIKELQGLESLNTALCQQVLNQRAACPLRLPIMLVPGMNDYNCALYSPQNFNLQVTASIGGTANSQFVMQVNTAYFSNALHLGNNTVTFTRPDNKPIMPPRFGDITNIQLIAVNPNYQLSSTGEILGRVAISSQVTIQIRVNNTLLNTNSTLLPPPSSTDGTVLWVDLSNLPGDYAKDNCGYSYTQFEALETSLGL